VPENYSVSALGSFPVKVLFYMGNNSVPKFIFCLSRFPVNRGSVLGRFYCISNETVGSFFFERVRKNSCAKRVLASSRVRWSARVKQVGLTLEGSS